MGKELEHKNWESVLAEITKHAPDMYDEDQGNYVDHPLAKQLRMTSDELQRSLHFLEGNGLIEYRETKINLTLKGFDVALQNQAAKRGVKFNRAALFLSLAITIFAVVQLLLGIPNLLEKWFVVIIISVALVISARMIIRRY